MVVPVAAALVVLVAALAGFAMVKFYGIIFLGQMRERGLKDAHDAGAWRSAASPGWPDHAAAGHPAIDGDPAHRCRDAPAARHGACRQARRAGLVDAGADLARARQLRAADFPRHHRRHAAARALAGAPPVSRPGAPHQRLGLRLLLPGPRAQDTAEGFSQPIRRIFEPMFRMQRHFPPRATASPITASRSRTISGTGSTCPWPDWPAGYRR
jgi:hydrogenase-4 component B